MQRIIILLLGTILGITAAQAQLQAEISPMAGNPFMSSGRNNTSYGSMTARLQISYKEEFAPWQPYLALAISAMQLPLHNKQINNLAMPILNTSVTIGINGEIKNNEHSIWTLGGGIGVCMLRPDGSTLSMDGNETFLGYTALTDNAWFPQVELSGRWICYPRSDISWYLGVHMVVAGIWLRDTKVRYTTLISGTNYNFNFNDIAVWPSVGAIIGYRF